MCPVAHPVCCHARLYARHRLARRVIQRIAAISDTCPNLPYSERLSVFSVTSRMSQRRQRRVAERDRDTSITSFSYFPSYVRNCFHEKLRISSSLSATSNRLSHTRLTSFCTSREHTVCLHSSSLRLLQTTALFARPPMSGKRMRTPRHLERDRSISE